MSATNGVAPGPISAAAASSRSSDRLAIATRAPSRASAAAIALPIPLLAPITSATFPSKPSSIARAYSRRERSNLAARVQFPSERP